MRRTHRVGLPAALAAVLAAAVGMTVVLAPAQAAAKHRDAAVTRAFAATTRLTAWSLAQRLRLTFPTHHPQGFALVGDKIFMSSVEILEPTVKFPQPVGGTDRTPGKGVGHVFVMDRQGNLLRDIIVGEGTMYHPGGIDFDGRSVWVPVAEYRPTSQANVYRINPSTFAVTKAFHVADHVGGVVRDRVSGQLHGVSWGSRTLYSWTVKGSQLTRSANRNHMVDYQDCAYAGWRKQICSGITALPRADGGSYELGGLALLGLRKNRILHEVPFPYFSAAGHVATRNPVALEVAGPTLRLFAAPDDGEETSGTELLVYESPIG